MRAFFSSVLRGIDREAWVRFLIAVFGLVLAFAAALLSTASREAGNLWATAIFATSALLLAAIVGVTTVPYLARRVASGRVKDILEFEVTREGYVYLVLTVLIGVAALNTGNNLLFLIVAAMLAAVLVSGFASLLNLKGLELEVTLPAHIFAGRHVIARLFLRVKRPFLPMFSASIVPPKVKKAKVKWVWHRAMFEFPKKTAFRKPWIRWPDVALERVTVKPAPPGIFQESVYFPYIAARETATADVDLYFEKRGRYSQDEFGIATRFPFSFLRKTRRVALAKQIIVFPSVEQTDEFFEVLPMITGEFETNLRGRGSDLYRIREYEPEDSARHVDWKSTAKSGSLKVREFTREDERKLRVVFDNPAPGKVTEEQYERAIALAASLSWHFSGEYAQITYTGSGYENRANEDVYTFLEYLALVEPGTGDSVLDHLKMTDDYNLVFTARPHGSIPTQLWQSSYFVFMQDR